jgi:xylose isomerase
MRNDQDGGTVSGEATATRAQGGRIMTDVYQPVPEDHFTFGLWTVGNPGRDPFGHETRAPLDPVDTVYRLSDLGAYGVSFHDDDLVPPGSSPAERGDVVKRFRRALDATGLKVPMTTTNLFSRPVFKEGAFTANDPEVRRFAVAKTLDAIDLGVELGATVFVMWGGREGVEAEAAKDVRGALDRYAEAVNLCCAYVRERRYDLRFALEPKPNEPRGDIFLPTVGHALAFIHELEWPEMVGVNPEFAHETMSGLSFTHAVAQALWQDKLFHIDLNAQRIGKFDQDFRFGSEGIRDAFYLVKLLEDAGWDGMRHFDAHAYRTEDADGVWDFARGSMRNYLILREKVRQFHDDREIAASLATAGVASIFQPTSPDGLGADAIDALRSSAGTLSESELGGTGYGHERLDQLATELLLGVRAGR